MRRIITNADVVRLLKAATVLSIGGLTAGCSSGVVRFTDGFYTGAVPQAAVAQAPDGYGTPNYSAGVDPSTTGSVATQSTDQIGMPRTANNRMATPHPVAPVNSASAASGYPAAPAYPSASAYPSAPAYPSASAYPAAPAAPARSSVSSEMTASITREPLPARVEPAAPSRPAPAESTSREGWSTAGATRVTMRDGETIYNLAKRYGVPANAIMEANGISDAKSVSAGQHILIPTYVYSRTVGVSAPDRNPATQAAKSSLGNRNTAAMANAPTPQIRPAAPAVAQTQPAAPARAAAIADGGRYTVVAGDTLSAISRRTGASIAAIKQVNSMTSDTVRLGQTLIIPGLSDTAPTKVAAAARVDPIETGAVERSPAPKPAVRAYTPPTQSAKTEDAAIEKIEKRDTASAPQATGVKTMRWPLQGRVISAFGSNAGGKGNDGIDISVPKGTPVKSAENGVVIYAGDGLKELGKTILVRHQDGIVTVYGHVDGIDVKRGDTVRRGQQIASSGMSGSAKQPQLHFEVRKNSKPVNPLTYLE